MDGLALVGIFLLLAMAFAAPGLLVIPFVLVQVLCRRLWPKRCPKCRHRMCWTAVGMFPALGDNRNLERYVCFHCDYEQSWFGEDRGIIHINHCPTVFWDAWRNGRDYYLELKLGAVIHPHSLPVADVSAYEKIFFDRAEFAPFEKVKSDWLAKHK